MAEPTVPLKIELPTELVELLAADGDAMLIAFEAVIAEARRIAASGLIQERRELLAKRSTERRVAMSSAGRIAYRFYRRRVAQIPSGLSKADRSEFRSGVKSSIASEMGLAPTLLQIAMARHKTVFATRLKKRRLLSCVRLVLAGLSNGVIADRWSIHSNTVSSLVREARELAVTRGLSLSELERLLTSDRLKHTREIAVQSEALPENVIDWTKVRSNRGESQ